MMTVISHHNAGKCASQANIAATPAQLPVFSAAFQEEVTTRFHRLTAMELVTSMMDLGRTASAVDAPAFPQHPLCRDSGCGGRCAQGWRSLLAELALSPEVRRHECAHGMLSASVPFVWHHGCLAVGRLVCPAAIGRESFEHGIELLEVLWENLVGREAEGWAVAESPVLATRSAPANGGDENADIERTPTHAKVRKALEYIDEHFADPNLNADGIARLLNVNPTYLAHLFAGQLGVRMSRYIADRRIGLAKRLLAGTTWQIKHVARRAGYLNPDWFSHVFHVHTGMKPCEYRRLIRNEDPMRPN